MAFAACSMQLRAISQHMSAHVANIAKVAVFLLAASVSFAPGATLRQSFDMAVLWNPVPVRVTDGMHLVYELRLANFAAESLELTRLSVTNVASGSILAEFRREELSRLIGRVDHPTGGESSKRVIPAGAHAVVYLTIPYQEAGTMPPELTHKLEYVTSSTHEVVAVEGGRFKASDQTLAPLGPPLRGGIWVAVYDSSWERGHRRALYTVNGNLHVPGRFAVDWIKVDGSGKYFDGDGSKVADWHGYGAEVLAVADSVVAAARDDISESKAVSQTPTKAALEDASGNYVALDLDGQHYAFYEHLQPGSVKVKPGDHVKSGQVIGLLGYTGESTGPHLHFHVSNNNSPLDAEGLPYAFAGFKLLGAYLPKEAFAQSQPWTPLPADKEANRRAEFPESFSVVEFSQPIRH